MAVQSMAFSRLWGFYVVNVVITGWCIANVNQDNASMLYAWMVSLCDMVYITDALTRGSKRLMKEVIAKRSTSTVKKSALVAIVLLSLKVLTLLPFHVLAIYELDESMLYPLVCLVRLFVIFTSGRLNTASAVSRQTKSDQALVCQRKKKVAAYGVL